MQDDFTIDELIDQNRSVVAVCRSCREEARFDLLETRRAFGGAMRLNRIALRVLCENCGAADCSVIVSAPHAGERR